VLTLLFTDIEGSTRLWETVPDHMEPAVRGHNEAITTIVTAAGGTVVRFMGDGVFARFADGPDAVGAAVAIQRRFASHGWAGVGPLRLRAGLHTGMCTIHQGEVFGRAPNLASRLESAAHGGQILLSDVTARACAGRLPPGCQLFDMGRYHIRGFDEPVVVHSVVAQGLTSVFPPLRTPFRGFDELPSEDSALYGRDAEIDDVAAMLLRHRLVTLWGPGGVGKTRVALRVAARARRPYEDGVRFVDLSTADSPVAVPAMVASALRAQPASGETAAATVLRVLRPSRLMLVLDNCERFAAAVRDLTAPIVADCPDVHILATSREILDVSIERTVEIRGLTVPSQQEKDTGRIAASDAVRMFADKARQAVSHFSLTDETAQRVAALCRALDGLPLAIELAAGRLDVETLDDLAQDPPALITRLDGTGGAGRGSGVLEPVRWAMARLTDVEVDMFRRVATFAGSFSRRAALQLGVEPVQAGRSFDRLVRTSLVVRDPIVADRFRLLATAREFARSSTSEAQRRTYQDAHARLMLARVEDLEPRLLTRDEARCVEMLRADFADCRAAVEFFLGNDRIVEAARMVVALSQFALLEPRPEVYGWASTIASRIDDDVPKASEVLGAAAHGAWFAGDTDRAVALGLRAVAAAPGGSTRLAHNTLMDAFGNAGQFDAATTHYLAMLQEMRNSTDPYWQIGGLVHEAISRTMIGQHETAENRAERAVALARRLGCPSGMRFALYGLGWALARYDPVAASAAFEQAMDAAREVNSRFTHGLALAEWVELRRTLGDTANAVTGTSDLLELIAVSGNRFQLSQVLREAGLLLADAGRHEVAALVLVARSGLPEMPTAARQASADESCLRELHEIIGEGWTALAVRAKAMHEHELISLCRRELADLAGACAPGEPGRHTERHPGRPSPRT
jgi:predicted ATPase/class 3 adenylate cyclase